MGNIFTAEVFRIRHDSDEKMKRLFNQIDPHFHDLSNEDKMKVRENCIEEHDKGNHKEEPD